MHEINSALAVTKLTSQAFRGSLTMRTGSMVTNVELSAFGLGTSRLASLGGALSQKAATHLILTALEHGVKTIDTADAYGSGDCERMIGRALAGRRKDSFLMTKAGYRYTALPAFLSPLNQIGTKIRKRLSCRQDFSRKYLLRSIGRSLKRLNTDYLDVFFLHEPPDFLIDESWEALRHIRQLGLSRLTGISTNSFAVVREGIASGQVDVLQTSVSPQVKERSDVLDLCFQSGIPVVANEVLKARTDLDRLGESWKHNLEVFNQEVISNIRLLIEYAASQPGVYTVLIGTRSANHLLKDIEPVSSRFRSDQFAAEMERILS